MNIRLKSVSFGNSDGFQQAIIKKVAPAAPAMGTQLGEEIKTYVAGKSWRHSPGTSNGPAVITASSVTMDVDTTDKIYLWVDKGTKPVSITGKTTTLSNGRVVGKMRFRFQGRGVSYASRTDGQTGGDGRGQMGASIRATNVSDRSIRARNITDAVIKERKSEIVAAGQRAID